jgi:hypothetical protein
MQFDNDSGLIIKRLLQSFDKCQTHFPKQLRNITDNLYTGFAKGDKYYQTRVSPVKANVRSNGNIHYPTTFEHIFFPTSVRQHITETIVYQLEYRCKILGREITIRIALLHKDELMKLDKYENDVAFMCNWLYNCIQHTSSTSCKHITIYFYPTMIKKRLPSRKTDMISVEHVNSAFTSRCIRNAGEIIIYRNEEWKKVFIHETFHTFSFDIQPHIENDIHEILQKKFSINTIFSISEAYTEVWARIINAAYCSYMSTQKNGEGLKEFAVYMNFSLQMERIFSLLQMYKILEFQNMNYHSLLQEQRKIQYENQKYKEDAHTNVFGYYILSGIIMNGYADFILLCNSHNLNLFKFSGTSKTIDDFVRLIEKNFHKKHCGLNHIVNTGKRDRFIKTTTRMSVIELFD